MRKIFRVVACAAAAAAMTVAFATPGQAALSVTALWNMDSLPRMVDSAGGDNNGSTSNISSGGSGLYKFNGTGSIATVPDKANLDPGSAAIKLTARISFSTVPSGTYDIVRKGVKYTTGGYYKMEIIRSAGAAVAACSFKGSPGVRQQIFGTVNLAGKGLQTITCTKTASSIQLTAGGQTRTSTVTIGPMSNSSAVYVGGKGDGTDYFPGLMDFVRIDIG